MANASAWARDPRTGAWLNTTSLEHVGDWERRPLRDWAAFKYAVHVDGVTASSKLQQLSLLGSLARAAPAPTCAVPSKCRANRGAIR